jgi:hypothetical protein
MNFLKFYEFKWTSMPEKTIFNPRNLRTGINYCPELDYNKDLRI